MYICKIMIRKSDYSILAKSYDTLSHSYQLKELVASFFKTKKYNEFSRFELAKTINDTIFRHYEGEEILKYKLAKEFRKRNYVAAFEVKANSSRTDFLVINGDTKSFEIKSKIDTLNRLKKQIDDYGDVFEYNHVVIDKIHLKKVIDIVPTHYGIWSYEGAKRIIHQEADYSPNINAIAQLNLLNKKELTKSFGSSIIQEIIVDFDNVLINSILKETLKSRYTKKWNFIVNNWDDILPIDLQFFFSSNLSPDVVYADF